jgi:hypothetical protein
VEKLRIRALAASGLAVAAAAGGWLVAHLPIAARAVGRVVAAAVDGWRRRPGARGRELARRARLPLANLYVVHPDARRATPREIGLRSIDLDEIAGTAVAGPTQRGADFKPLPPFRSHNGEARWQRMRQAVDRMTVLPPIDVVRYPPGGKVWVLDGHNRVAAALEFGQVAIDANVTELVPPGQNPSERPGDLAATLAGTHTLRAAGQGARLQSVGDETAIHRVTDLHGPDGTALAPPSVPEPTPVADGAASAPSPSPESAADEPAEPAPPDAPVER